MTRGVSSSNLRANPSTTPFFERGLPPSLQSLALPDPTCPYRTPTAKPGLVLVLRKARAHVQETLLSHPTELPGVLNTNQAKSQGEPQPQRVKTWLSLRCRTLSLNNLARREHEYRYHKALSLEEKRLSLKLSCSITASLA